MTRENTSREEQDFDEKYNIVGMELEPPPEEFPRDRESSPPNTILAQEAVSQAVKDHLEKIEAKVSNEGQSATSSRESVSITNRIITIPEINSREEEYAKREERQSRKKLPFWKKFPKYNGELPLRERFVRYDEDNEIRKRHIANTLKKQGYPGVLVVEFTDNDHLPIALYELYRKVQKGDDPIVGVLKGKAYVITPNDSKHVVKALCDAEGIDTPALDDLEVDA